MIREGQKAREKDIVKVFLSAFENEYNEFEFITPKNEETDKSDVSFQYKDENNLINFQVKEIPFHPDDKTLKQNSKEVGLTASNSRQEYFESIILV